MNAVVHFFEKLKITTKLVLGLQSMLFIEYESAQVALLAAASAVHLTLD